MKVISHRRRITCQTVIILIAFVITAMLVAGCGDEERLVEEGPMSISVTSAAFNEGDRIPDGYTCQGQDISPPLAWSELPGGTRFFALIMDDPDAPGGAFTHWLIFNIPVESRQLAEGVSSQAQLPGGALQGKNDFGGTGYRGPCPPRGSSHRYQFTLYSLDKALDLKEGASRKQVLEAMEGHIIARGRLTGTYQR